VQNIPSTISSNISLLADYISYHIVHGNLENTSYTSSPSGGSPGSGYTSTLESSPTLTLTQTSTPIAESGISTATLIGRLFGRDQNSSRSDFPQILAAVSPNVTLGRTLLRSSDLVTLGGKAQALAWTRTTENCRVVILNQPCVSNLIFFSFYVPIVIPCQGWLWSVNYPSSQNVTIVNATTWRNLFINAITGVLVPPGNLTSTFAATNVATNVAAAQGFFNSVQLPSLNGTNETAIDALQEASGFTLFIPNNDAFTSDVNQTIQNLQNNQTALTTLLQNHVRGIFFSCSHKRELICFFIFFSISTALQSIHHKFLTNWISPPQLASPSHSCQTILDSSSKVRTALPPRSYNPISFWITE